MKKLFIAILNILLLFCFSCVRSRVMPQPGITYEPTNESYVEIYYVEPEKSYIKIGMVEARGAAASSWKKVENYMRMEASKIGGDAVIILKQDRPVGSITSSGILVRKKYLRGIVIKWKNNRGEWKPDNSGLHYSNEVLATN